MEKIFTDTFLEKDEDNPTGYSLKTGKIGRKATAAYKKTEDTFVGGSVQMKKTIVSYIKQKMDRLK